LKPGSSGTGNKRYESSLKREEARIMKKDKKAYKGWVDPMATPYQYKKG